MTDTLVFIGDSITDAGRREDPAGLGSGFVRRIAHALAAGGDPSHILNRGIGGDRAVDLRARWADDVLALDPDVLTVYVGINDTWRRYDDDDATSAEAFESDYRAVLAEVVESSAPRLILVEPYVVPVSDDQRAWAEDLDPKRDVVARLAREFDASLVPLHRIMNEAAVGAGPRALAWDGVHPTPAGDEVIAAAWLVAWRRA